MKPRLEMVRLDEIVFADRNPKDHDLEGVIASIERFGFEDFPTRNEATGKLVEGHGRVTALLEMRKRGSKPPENVIDAEGMWWCPLVVGQSWASDDEAEAYLLAHNQLTTSGGWKKSLAQVLADLQSRKVPIDRLGWGDRKLMDILNRAKGGGRPPLAARFGVPPFSVLDARQGYWKDRKREWFEWGIKAAAGREHLPSTVAQGRTNEDGTRDSSWFDRSESTSGGKGGSSFDPVLAELVFRWFCPAAGSVLDPFAGESTKGLVAAALGCWYTGVELRAEQVSANQTQAAELQGLLAQPRWICGDSSKLAELVPEGERYDLVFTSPPYYDLEIYSESDKDGSAFATYDRFMQWYEQIFSVAVARLRQDRFVVVKIGEIRDKKTGVYRNFVGGNIAMFERLGVDYYNEAVLVTPVASMPLRAGRHFASSRKLEKGHQNVLAFYKGDPERIRDHFPDEVVSGAELSGKADPS